MRRCAKVGCRNPGEWRPVLVLRDNEIVRLEMPVLVCTEHRERSLARSLVTARVLKRVEAVLSARGLKMPPWSRARMEFDLVV